MRILVVNAGSSSLKCQILDGDVIVGEVNQQRWSPSDGFAVIDDLVRDHGPIEAIGHRVVHGGLRLSEATLIDEEVVRYLESTVDLAPLHQPPALAAIHASRSTYPAIPQVACPDTAFHRSIPEAASTYALPAGWNRRWGLRRYGFHGLSHAYAARSGAKLVGRDWRESRIVSAHLGAGASLCAVNNAHSVDTTMGFTPLEGLVMATRSGSVDPGLLMWLQLNADISARELAETLSYKSGLAGLSQTSGDLRDVVDAAKRGSREAQLALAVFNHRLATMCGSMITSLGGVDVIVFTGGIGEHSSAVRAALVDSFAFLGAAVDVAANELATSDAVITAEESSVSVVVVTAREDLEIARQTRAVVEAT